jgi:hypothetical protein
MLLVLVKRATLFAIALILSLVTGLASEEKSTSRNQSSPTSSAERDNLQTEFDAAWVAYNETVGTQGETARLRYVTKLGDIYYARLKNYWASGDQNEALTTQVYNELRSHPAPPNSNSIEWIRLLLGKWQSPRRIYVFRSNGKCGTQDGAINTPWRISGNQLIQGNSRGIIILLNSDYLIYSEGDSVFFHARVKD